MIKKREILYHPQGEDIPADISLLKEEIHEKEEEVADWKDNISRIPEMDEKEKRGIWKEV
jgi:hypothetical protein